MHSSPAPEEEECLCSTVGPLRNRLDRTRCVLAIGNHSCARTLRLLVLISELRDHSRWGAAINAPKKRLYEERKDAEETEASRAVAQGEATGGSSKAATPLARSSQMPVMAQTPVAFVKSQGGGKE